MLKNSVCFTAVITPISRDISPTLATGAAVGEEAAWCWKRYSESTRSRDFIYTHPAHTHTIALFEAGKRPPEYGWLLQGMSHNCYGMILHELLENIAASPFTLCALAAWFLTTAAAAEQKRQLLLIR